MKPFTIRHNNGLFLTNDGRNQVRLREDSHEDYQVWFMQIRNRNLISQLDNRVLSQFIQQEGEEPVMLKHDCERPFWYQRSPSLTKYFEVHKQYTVLGERIVNQDSKLVLVAPNRDDEFKDLNNINVRLGYPFAWSQDSKDSQKWTFDLVDYQQRKKSQAS